MSPRSSSVTNAPPGVGVDESFLLKLSMLSIDFIDRNHPATDSPRLYFSIRCCRSQEWIGLLVFPNTSCSP